MKVWILEACYSYEGCQIVDVFDHEPAKAEIKKAIKESGQHEFADDFPVRAYEVTEKKNKVKEKKKK